MSVGRLGFRIEKMATNLGDLLQQFPALALELATPG